MNDGLLRENNFKSPAVSRRYPSSHAIYMNYVTNRNLIPINNINDINENINGSNINLENNYIDFRRTMKYNNDIKKQLINEGQNTNINNYISNLTKENLSLHTYIKKFKKEISLRDNEIDGYKQKVKALLAQVKDKNNDLTIKKKTILKLSEEKKLENNNMSQNRYKNNELNLMKIKLQLSVKENEKYHNENMQLKHLIQNIKIKNKPKKINLKKQLKNNNLTSYEQNVRESEKSSSDFNRNINIFTNRENDLIINSFGLSIKSEINNKNNFTEENYNKLLLQKDIQIKKLNKIIEDLKNELIKSKKEISESNNIKEYNNNLLLSKEKIINEFSKNINEVKKENSIKIKELNQKNKEFNELKLKYDTLMKDIENKKYTNNNNINDNLNGEIYENEKKNLESTIRQQKSEIDLNSKKVEELENRLNNIEIEKLNKERIIEELNEDLEGQKESIENYKNELNKNKLLFEKNEELKKDNDKLYSDNVKLKDKVNKLSEELENEQNLKKEIENEKNKIKERNEQLLNDKEELSQKIISIQDNYNNSQKEIEKIKNINNNLMEQIKNHQNKNYTEIAQREHKIEGKNKSKNSNINNLDKNIKINENEEDDKIEYNFTDINNNDNNDINLVKKENDILQKRILQLNELIQDLNNQINNLNIKYKEQKNENKNLKEASHALIEKQKIELEEKDKHDHISPETHFIITKKVYNKLIWYLVSTIDPKSNNQNHINNYDNYKWVTELVIPKAQLNKFNKFEDDENKINDLYSYIQKLQSKLEKKEEELNKKDYANKKLNNQLQNKTANIKQGPSLLSKAFNNNKNNILSKSNSNQNFSNIKNTINSDLIAQSGDVEKYKNLLDKLNDYGEREIKFQNEINKLKTQLKDQEDLQSGINNIKDISHHFESNFIEDVKEEKNVIDLLSNKEQKIDDENYLDILKDVPGNKSDSDEVKGYKKLTKNLKKEIREKEGILNELIEQIKEIFKELKWNSKNNQRVSQILKILGYTPEVIKIIIDNKKGYNFDFNMKLKK